MAVRVEVPKDPGIIIAKVLGYDDNGIITDKMLDKVTFPTTVPQPKQSILSLEKDDLGGDMNPQPRTALERRQWDKMTVHHFDFEEESVKFALSKHQRRQPHSPSPICDRGGWRVTQGPRREGGSIG
eukprot:scaffold225093_cov68-Attheya_sp.AAC.2